MHSIAWVPELGKPAHHSGDPAWPEKDTAKGMERPSTPWEKAFASHTANKSLVFRIDQECSKLALKKPTQFFLTKDKIFEHTLHQRCMDDK